MGGKNSYESIKRYEDKAYDKVLLRLPKGEKEVIQEHARAGSESVNGFISRAIDEALETDIDNETLEALVEQYNKTGIITRLDNRNMILRSWSKKARRAMEQAGCANILGHSVQTPLEWEEIIFDRERYSLQEIKEYVDTHLT